MFNLTINDEVYDFNFGIGFVRDINKRKQVKNEDGELIDFGLQHAVLSLYDEDPVELVEILVLANKTESNKCSRAKIEKYIEDESTDVSALCKELLDFFGQNNATKKKTEAALEYADLQKKKAEQEKAAFLASLNAQK